MSGGWGGGIYQNNYQGQSPRKPSEEDARNAARSLARLMEKQLGYCEGHIDAVAFRLFIRAYWSRVSKWAHEIHDSQE